MTDSEARAKRVLLHYFKLAIGTLSPDCCGEIEGIVDNILDAAAAAERSARRLPIVQERSPSETLLLRPEADAATSAPVRTPESTAKARLYNLVRWHADVSRASLPKPDDALFAKNIADERAYVDLCDRVCEALDAGEFEAEAPRSRELHAVMLLEEIAISFDRAAADTGPNTERSATWTYAAALVRDRLNRSFDPEPPKPGKSVAIVGLLEDIFQARKMGGRWALTVRCGPGYGIVGPWRDSPDEAEQDKASLMHAIKRELAGGPAAPTFDPEPPKPGALYPGKDE